jgi:hypothetical protein
MTSEYGILYEYVSPAENAVVLFVDEESEIPELEGTQTR